MTRCLTLVGRCAARYGALLQAPRRQPDLCSPQTQAPRRFHGSPPHAKGPPVPAQLIDDDDKKGDKAVAVRDDLFERVAQEAKTKATFNKVVDVFVRADVRRRGHVEFIYAALSKMPEFGVERELAVYNRLLDVFPKEVFVPRNFIQRMFNHYPRQQEFKHVNPFPVPQHLPEDPVDLARFSLTRIANDRDARLTVHQSPSQVELLAEHNPSRPVFVEGPFPLWLRRTCVYYYVLRADPVPPHEKVEKPYDPERCLDYPLQLELDLDRDLGDEENFDVEDLDEGPVFAMCMAGRGDQAVLNQWISGLQENNPILGRVPTLFRLDAGPRELQGAAQSAHHQGPEPEAHTEENLR
ncbi:Evolutionarily conserved signaling intermediate in Toll pathway, mitochondrial [Liparis tanakae]|uniref:Evolutionarily conserved signaling intermediate in Toll pathway, mitochondrial n=1 Tax=Liparis tanakae TaxID=230148 RepID=A0A4Z2GU98_9TELE|nr:Evolutionarily conserved signaling intermediate in Toll pathway, mitochondrial [Liparis tanakae]